MARQPIAFEELTVRAHHLWAHQWMLLTCGDFAAEQFNTMTVGWGSLGTMWGRPFAQVVVRPVRYTYEFMEEHDTFTLCAFPELHREAVQYLGTVSGRNEDKITECGLTPIASTQVSAPAFAEADLIIECKKIYFTDMEPSRFLDPAIEDNYPQKDYHRIYFGQIVAIAGEEPYRA